MKYLTPLHFVRKWDEQKNWKTTNCGNYIFIKMSFP